MAGRIFVVVPTAGQCKLLPRTLASLANCEQPEKFTGVIVVENGSQGGAQDAAESAPAHLRCNYLHVERANKSNALNQVFAQFDDDDLIYLIDDDVRFSTNCIVEFATAAANVNGGEVYGGALRIDSEQEPPEQWREFLPGSMKGWEPAADEFDPATGFFLGANWAVFAGDIRKAGGFDPRFGPGSPLGATGQEWTMQVVLRERNVKFRYLPHAIVWHHVDFSRFSHDFLLHRKYRGGLEGGIRAADYMHGSPRWYHRVRHPVAHTWWKLFRNRMAGLLHRILGNEMTAFRSDLKVQHAWGFLRGYSITAAELRDARNA